MSSLTKNIESKNYEFQTIPGLVTTSARLRQDFAEVQREIENRDAKLALL